MSPATRRFELATVIDPLATTSPPTLSVPEPFTEMAAPPTPPHPAWVRAAMAGVKRRLFTPPDALAAMFGLPPLVRILANSSCSDRFPTMLKRLPCGPSFETNCVSTVPSEKVHVTVSVPAPGVP